MANPQTEHGYTRVANELLEAVLLADLGKREQKVVWAVIRLTYGFNKKEDTLSFFQIGNICGMDRAHAGRAIKSLAAKGVLHMRPSGRQQHGQDVHVVGLNKDYSQWQTVAETATESEGQESGKTVAKKATVAESAPLPKQQQNRCQIGTETVAKTAPSKDRKTEKTERGRSSARRSKDEIAEEIAKRELPDWMPRDIWEAFVWYRREKRKDLTDYAAKLAIKHLGQYREQGDDPREVLERSIANGWTGVFPLKNQQGQNQRNDNKTEATLDDASPV